MSIWLYKIKNNTLVDFDYSILNNYKSIEVNDCVYNYIDDEITGTFILKNQLVMKEDNELEENSDFIEKNIDLPYTVLYKTKSGNTLVELTEKEIQFIINPLDKTEEVIPKNKVFKSFLSPKEINTEDIKPKDITKNILFNIGQPNTGKSYKFEESNLFTKEEKEKRKYKYLKIPVSGGIGNEYKGLQNTDLAITYDPIKEELRFGEFLQMLMSAIVNPTVPHVVFLDDFHNQDISSLLSEYTPLFKGQQKRDIVNIDSNHSIFNSEFNNVDDFIEKWNTFIETHCIDAPIVPITNRISGQSLKLVYPSNFYLLGGANFNENSLNIFADWEDRATITYLDPIKSFDKDFSMKDDETDDNKVFLECCKELNKNLKELLEAKEIFDYEKYCFGMWKIVNKKGYIINDLEEKKEKKEQKKLISFFFGMIKNSLKYNNKNSEINSIGKDLIETMSKTNKWFKENIEKREDIDKKILHQHNIYEDEI